MTANLDTGMGPLGSEQGGRHATVEVARSVYLIFIKKFVIIYTSKEVIGYNF